eukprot:scaffold10199_cov146-Cylindrotheca_fusiformis.AAC.24
MTSLNSYYGSASCPATEALKQAQEMKSPKRQSAFDLPLSSVLFDLSFTGDFEAFPTIEWDSDDGLDSVSSIRSMDTVNSLLGDDPTGYLGKRRRRDERGASNSRLVRSKKIKSDLASLPFTMPMTRRP